MTDEGLAALRIDRKRRRRRISPWLIIGLLGLGVLAGFAPRLWRGLAR